MDNKPISEAIFDIMIEYKLAIRATLKASELGLNGMHVKCLSFIQSTDECTANDIVIYFSRDKAQVARLIKEMITNEWLIKKANPEDKRSHFLSLTETGAELAEVVAEAQRELHLKMTQGLSNKEVEEFKRVASILKHNLKMQ